jgi:hypothetical protein
MYIGAKRNTLPLAASSHTAILLPPWVRPKKEGGDCMKKEAKHNWAGG